MLANSFRYTAAGVANGNFRKRITQLRRDRDRAGVRHRIACVDGEVENHLRQFLRRQADFGIGSIEIEREFVGLAE